MTVVAVNRELRRRASGTRHAEPDLLDLLDLVELRQIVEPVRIHDRERGRQRFIGEVMIDDDRLHAKPRRFRQRLMA